MVSLEIGFAKAHLMFINENRISVNLCIIHKNNACCHVELKRM
jgi:hypothetical protein